MGAALIERSRVALLKPHDQWIGSQGVGFMCLDDPEVVRYSHATDGGILARVDVKHFEHELQLC